jgi:hypothetical protein
VRQDPGNNLHAPSRQGRLNFLSATPGKFEQKY